MPWYRGINPKAELEILRIREKLSYDELQNQQPNHPNRDENIPNFTSLSAFQYIATGVRQKFFAKNAVGVLIQSRQEPRNIFWRENISRAEVSDAVFKTALSQPEFQRALKYNSFVLIKEGSVRQKVTEYFSDMERQYIKEGLNPDAIMAWTEGLFRYKMNEVAAVVIDPTNLSSCGMGYWFARQIEKTVGIRPKFAYYDKQTLEFVQTDISSQVQKAKAQARRQYEEHNDREGDNDNERNAQKATAKKSSWRQQIKNQSQHLKGHDRVV